MRKQRKPLGGYFIWPHPVYKDEAAYAVWVGQHGKESSTNVASASHFVAVRLKQYAFVAGPSKFCTNATNENKTVQQQWKQYFTGLMTQPTVSNECYGFTVTRINVGLCTQADVYSGNTQLTLLVQWVGCVQSDREGHGEYLKCSLHSTHSFNRSLSSQDARYIH